MAGLGKAKLATTPLPYHHELGMEGGGGATEHRTGRVGLSRNQQQYQNHSQGPLTLYHEFLFARGPNLYDIYLCSRLVVFT